MTGVRAGPVGGRAVFRAGDCVPKQGSAPDNVVQAIRGKGRQRLSASIELDWIAELLEAPEDFIWFMCERNSPVKGHRTRRHGCHSSFETAFRALLHG